MMFFWPRAIPLASGGWDKKALPKMEEIKAQLRDKKEES